MKRRLLIVAGVLLAAILLLPYIVSAERFRPVLAQRLSAATGKRVDFGAISLRVIPLSLRVDALKIEGLLAAESVRVRARLLPLLSGDVEIDGVDLVRPVYEHRNSGPAQNSADIVLKEITITGGAVVVGGDRYEHIDAAITSPSAGRYEGRAIWRTPKFGAVELRDPLTVELAHAPAETSVRIANASVAPRDGGSGMKINGAVSAELKIRDGAANGEAKLTNFEIAGGDVREPLRIAAATLKITPDQISASPFSLTAGPTKVTASGAVTNYTKDLAADITIDAPNARIEDLAALAKAYGVSGINAKGVVSFRARINDDMAFSIDKLNAAIGESHIEGSVQSRGNNLTFDLKADKLSTAEMRQWYTAKGGTSKTRVNGTITVGRFTADTQVLENVKSGLQAHGGVIKLEPLTANVNGGTMAGAVTLQNETVAFKGKFEKVELQTLTKAVSGPITADADIRLTPGADLMKSLDGSLALAIDKGKIMPVNLIGALGGLMKDGPTPFVAVRGKLSFSQGVATTDEIALELDRALAKCSGKMNLVDQSLDLRLLTTMNKQLSEELAKTAVGNLLAAAIASPSGELMMPSLVRGTIAKPVITPDAGAVARLQQERLKSGLKGIFDAFKKK
jgi:hypothetical protein